MLKKAHFIFLKKNIHDKVHLFSDDYIEVKLQSTRVVPKPNPRVLAERARALLAESRRQSPIAAIASNWQTDCAKRSQSLL